MWWKNWVYVGGYTNFTFQSECVKSSWKWTYQKILCRWSYSLRVFAEYVASKMFTMYFLDNSSSEKYKNCNVLTSTNTNIELQVQESCEEFLSCEYLAKNAFLEEAFKILGSIIVCVSQGTVFSKFFCSVGSDNMQVFRNTKGFPLRWFLALWDKIIWEKSSVVHLWMVYPMSASTLNWTRFVYLDINSFNW